MTIKDLIISGASTNSTSSYIGALAGYMSGSCTVSNVHIKDYSVNSPISYGVGGFVGQIWTEDASDRFEFIGCSTENVDVTGYANVGGIWGTSTSSKGTIGIYNCILNGTVDTINVNGGICGGYGASAPVEIIGLDHSGLNITVKDNPTDKLVAYTSTSANANEQPYAGSEYEAVKDENGKWTAHLPLVAQVGEKQYTSLAEAIKNATPGSEVTLLKDIALVEQISIDKDLTLNLNQHTLTNSFESSTQSGEDRFSLLTKGNVTIKNGTYVSNGGVGTRGIGQYSGNLTLQDVTTTCKDINVCNYAEGGKLTISNSTVSGDYAVGSFANKSTVEISKSKLVGETCGLYHNGSYYGLKLTVADTTIEGGNDAVATGDTNDSSGVYISGSTQTTAANGGEDQQAKFTNCIISGGTAVEVKYTDLVLENCNAFTTSTGEPTYEQFNNGSTTAGFSVVATDNSMKPNDPAPGGSVIITDGFYKGMVGLRGLIDQSEEYQNFKETTYTISGGHFTSDPTAYLANGYVAVASDKDGYVYQVVKATNTPAEVVPESPKVENNLPENASEDDKKLAASVSEKLNNLVVDEDIVKAAAGTVASQNTITVDEGRNALQSAGITSSNVTIVVQPYLDVTLTDANSEDQNFTVDITPMYRTVATTNVDDIVVKGETTGEPANAVVIGEPKELTINKTVEVSMPLPNGFTSDETLYVHHQKNNVTYVYEGAVKDNALTFTNPHGFSLFTITSAAPQAKIGEVNYATLQDAVNVVENGETIELLADGSATVSREITFTIEGNSKADITAGSGYKLTQNGNTYTITEKSTSSGGASHPEAGSTSSSSDRYQIDKPSKVENGSIKVSDSKAEKGDTVTITVTPDEGYELDELAVYDEDGDEIELTDKGDGKFTFKMPKGNVEIEVSFAAIQDETVKADFADVTADAWYADAVQYVFENGMMSGTSETTFSPDLTTTRGMIVTILYRLENQPTVTGTTAFTDVAADQYYANAVAWAAQNGIVSGTSATTFAPNAAITREQMAAILYRYAQFKGYDVSAKADLSVYTDAAQVGAYAADAMAWANGAQLITGTSATTLTPAGQATRAQVATILMRFCENIVK